MMTAVTNFEAKPLPKSTRALREDVQTFLRSYKPKLTEIQKAKSWMGFDREFSKALAKKGFIGLTVPKKFGGQGKDGFSRFTVIEELLLNGMPVGAHWIADRQSAPLILKYGTEEQKSFYLPKICSADAFFCIGMSEPNSGSDLASVRTRATKIDGGWSLSGQKIWTTNAHLCDFMIILVRTSGTAEDRHEGLSQFIVDLKQPGIDIRKIRDLTGDHHFNEVFFNEVFLPDNCLVGKEGAGWQQVISELAFERSGPERIYSSITLFDAWIQHSRDTALTSDAPVLAGKILTELITLRAMSLSVVAKIEEGEEPVIESAIVKDLGTELEQMIPHSLAENLATNPESVVSQELLSALAYGMQISPTYSLRGGTREILRGMIARGLGLR